MKYLSFDTRALALMRIALASVIIIDLSIRISDLEAFYANTGVAPLEMIFQYGWSLYYFSLHAMSGQWQFQFVLFMFAVFCAVMLLIGYRTRLFTFLSWLMMLSLHNRNVFILQGGDDMMRMLLFWGMFIPWGARYSCDSITGLRQEETQIRSLGTFAYLLQVCYLYTGSALLKGPEWNHDFTAVYYVYSLDQLAYPFTRYFYYYPDLLKVLTIIAYYFELLIPLFFFSPFKHQWLRLTGVILIIGFHLWNGATILIGIFFMVGIATSLGLLPSMAMDAFDRFTRKWKKTIAESFMGVAYPVATWLKWKTTEVQTGWLWDKIRSAALVFLIVFVADWNFSNLSFIHSKISEKFYPLALFLRIDQSWGMFAPGVLKDDGWYVFEAEGKGSCKNLLAPDEPYSTRKPYSVVGQYKNDRWRKYAENYMFADNHFMRLYFCHYYKRLWNEQHEEKINALRIVYMMEFTEPDYRYVIPSEEVLCECRD